jgi:mRNA-degrading endonuclease toxin of MazEF toxin-antitoxin module
VERGDVYWANLRGPGGRRPVVVVSRTSAVRVRTLVTIAPVTRTIRSIASEVPLGREQGLRARCVANCDSLKTVPKRTLTRRIGALDTKSLMLLDRALRFALGIRA